MSGILSLLKDALRMWKETTNMFWNKNGFFYFFFIALLAIVIFEKDRISKYTYVGYSIIVLIIIYNPITYYLCRDMFSGNYAYFARLYSMLPVPFVIAYATVFFIRKFNGVKKLGLFVAAEALVIVVGSNVYKEDWIQKAENYSKLSNEVIWISDMLHGVKEHVCIAAPTSIATELRQYDGSIMMPFGRDWGDRLPLRYLMDSENPDRDETLKLAGEKACDFIVVSSNAENRESFGDLELYGETDEFLIYSMKGVSRIERTYNDKCQVTEERNIDSDDNLYLNSDGYAIVRYEYDDSGNKSREFFYGTDEEPVTLSEGYSGISYTYDKRHRVTSMQYYDEEGNPCITSFNYSLIRYRYDKKDRVTGEYYFDESGNPHKQFEGYFGMEKEYNSNSRISKKIFVDEDKNPMIINTGYSEIICDYNDHGDIIKEVYRDINDELVMTVNGYYAVLKEYDEKHHLSKVTYVDEEDSPVMTGLGYASVVYTYDESGKQTEERYFGPDNEPVAIANGQYGERKVYEDGKISRTYYIDAEGENINISLGYSGISCYYDDSGRVSETGYLDEQGYQVSGPTGEYGLGREYDRSGQLISTCYLNKNHEPMINNSGMAKTVYKYDIFGRVIEEKYYDLDDKPLKLKTGEYGIQKSYNESSQIDQIRYIDNDGKIIKKSLGYSIIKHEYDDKGDISAVYYLDENGSPVPAITGEYGYTKEYDFFGNPICVTYVDENNSPVEIGKEKYSSLKLFYSENSNLLKREYYNLSGKVVREDDLSDWTILQHSCNSDNQAMFYTLQNNESGKLIVIDGGWTENADHVRQVIKDMGGTVDIWILTHYHEDHAGAYNAIKEDPQGIEIKKVYASSFDSDYDKYLEVAKDWDDPETMAKWMNASSGESNVYYPKRGDEINVDNLKITFLNTYDEKLMELNGEKDLPNNCALVTLIEGQNDSMLFMSDMYSEKVGDYLKEKYTDELKAKYLQPCHHGNSIMPYTFYDYIEPQAVFFDAPQWLMEGDEWNTKSLKEWCDEKEIRTYDYSTAPNEIVFYFR